MSCVYKHTFPNGAVYVGKTDMLPEDRWLNGWGYRNCPLMFNAILKFGWDNIEHEIIVNDVDHETAIEIETEEIRRHSEACTVYNIQSVPPQFLAQENTHFIDPSAQYPTYTSPPQCSSTKRHKDYIIPLTPKPSGVKTWPIDVYTTDGTYICTYPSTKVASNELGVNRGDISSCCKGVKSDGKARYQIKGYIFRYAVNKKEVG